jgi:hypothetical protein
VGSDDLTRHRIINEPTIHSPRARDGLGGCRARAHRERRYGVSAHGLLDMTEKQLVDHIATTTDVIGAQTPAVSEMQRRQVEAIRDFNHGSGGQARVMIRRAPGRERSRVRCSSRLDRRPGVRRRRGQWGRGEPLEESAAGSSDRRCGRVHDDSDDGPETLLEHAGRPRR